MVGLTFLCFWIVYVLRIIEYCGIMKGIGGIFMRLGMSKSKNSLSLYVIKSTYENKKHSTKIVEKLGTYNELLEKLNGRDPIEWANAYIEELNEKEKAENLEIITRFSQSKQIAPGKQVLFNGGYLFIQSLYHDLDLDRICKELTGKYKFTFDLNEILSRLIYTRILYPSSKLSSHEASRRFIEQPSFDLQHVYRSLDVLAKEGDSIQAAVYQSSLKTIQRNTGILYYDCTNYFFETEEASGLRQYGISKEHRPNPIVQMGLIMDGNGIPLAFVMNEGNMNEQRTLKPLEKRIIEDFKLSKFIMCTDGGLDAYENRIFNTLGDRAFVVTQSLKKLRAPLREWALERNGWRAGGSNETICLDDIDDTSSNGEIYYKSHWITENGIKQQLIVSYSPRYKAYRESIRAAQILRAEAKINQGKRIKNANDPERFIERIYYTEDGEIAKHEGRSLHKSVIDKEAMYDGFYGVCTNLDEDIQVIIDINKRRWEIEESFRILKTEFNARPVYLNRDDRIRAHFMTCFLSLLIYRMMEAKLKQAVTSTALLSTLKSMNFLQIKEGAYVPAYERTDITDALHDAFGFRTDYEVIPQKTMKKIIKASKML